MPATTAIGPELGFKPLEGRFLIRVHARELHKGDAFAVGLAEGSGGLVRIRCQRQSPRSTSRRLASLNKHHGPAGCFAGNHTEAKQPAKTEE